MDRCGNPEVACWISDHWVAGSNPAIRGMFHHKFHLIVHCACLACLANTVHKVGTKQEQFIYLEFVSLRAFIFVFLLWSHYLFATLYVYLLQFHGIRISLLVMNKIHVCPSQNIIIIGDIEKVKFMH